MIGCRVCVHWTGLAFSAEQFAKLAQRLPKALLDTRAELEKRLAA